MSNTYNEKAKDFMELHREGCFIMPNAWDAGSAIILQSHGYRAIGTTSAGIAFSNGYPDHGFCEEHLRMPKETMFKQIESIASNLTLPLSADLESGYGNSPEEVYKTVDLAIKSGAVGGNIEDFTGNYKDPILDKTLAIERVYEAKKKLLKEGRNFTLIARTDVYLTDCDTKFSTAVERANLFMAAGADGIFIPGVKTKKTIANLVKEINGPINVVMGFCDESLTFSDLAEIGVRRISVGGSLVRSLYKNLFDSSKGMKEAGDFSFSEHQISNDSLNNLFISNKLNL